MTNNIIRNDNVVSLTNSIMGTNTYNYDELNRLIDITNPDNQTVVYNYDSLSRRTLKLMPNGVSSTYAYDVVSRPTDLDNKLGVSDVKPPKIGPGLEL